MSGLIGYAVAWSAPNGCHIGAYIYDTYEEAARAADWYARPTLSPSGGIARLGTRVIELHESGVAMGHVAADKTAA